MQQLDLFLDGRDGILVNDIVAALLEGRLAEARGGLDRLGEESSAHPDLAAFDRLLCAACEGPPTPPRTGETGPMIETLTLLVSAATRLLGPGAPSFLLPWWRALARTEAVLDPTEAAPRLRSWIGSARWHSGDGGRQFAYGCPCAGSNRIPSRLRRRRCRAPSCARPGPHSTGSPSPTTAAMRKSGRSHGSRPGSRSSTGGWHTCFAPVTFPTPTRPLRALRLLPDLLVLESRGLGDDLVRHRRALRDISPRFFRTYRRLVVDRSPRRQSRGGATGPASGLKS